MSPACPAPNVAVKTSQHQADGLLMKPTALLARSRDHRSDGFLIRSLTS